MPGLVGEWQVYRSSVEFEKGKCAPNSEQGDSYLGVQTASDFTLLFPQAWSSLAHNKLDNSFLNSCLEHTGQFPLCDGAQELLWSSNDFSEFLWTRFESLFRSAFNNAPAGSKSSANSPHLYSILQWMECVPWASHHPVGLFNILNLVLSRAQSQQNNTAFSWILPLHTHSPYLAHIQLVCFKEHHHPQSECDPSSATWPGLQEMLPEDVTGSVDEATVQ